jgi:hypothetical protein
MSAYNAGSDGRVPSIKTIDVVTLIFTSAAWGALASLLAIDLLLKKPGTFRLILIGLLLASPVGVIHPAGDLLNWDARARAVAGVISLVLTAGGLACLVVGAIGLRRRDQPVAGAATP